MTDNSVPVLLRVYDLSRGMAKQLSPSLLGKQIDGIWHTGIYVFGLEYFYGGGIQAVNSYAVARAYNISPLEEMHLGNTTKSKTEFEAYLRSISHRYTPATYNLLTHNCNNFSNEIAQFLLQGNGIPPHIVNLPNEVFATPLGAMLRPMIENMQREMSGAIGNSAQFNTSNAPIAFPESQSFNTSSNVLHTNTSSNISTLRVKISKSGSPGLYFHQLVNRIEQLITSDDSNSHSISSQEIKSLQTLSRALADNKNNSSSVIMTSTDEWTCLLKLLKLSKSNVEYRFVALGLFRALLLLPAKKETIDSIRDSCLGMLFGSDDFDVSVVYDTPNQQLMLLCVILNGLANAHTKKRMVSYATSGYFSLIFQVLSTTSTPSDSHKIAAHILYRCGTSLQEHDQEGEICMSLVGGYVELLEQWLFAHNSNAYSNEHLVVITILIQGIEKLLQSLEAARNLALDLGLLDILHRTLDISSLESIHTQVMTIIQLV